jgi:cell division protein ZapD
VISYEYPLNEKVRTWLRLEDLFIRIDHFAKSNHSLDHHAAISTLFEILEVASRADLKSDLLKELEHQKRLLSSFHNNPDISQNALDGVLSMINQDRTDLLAMTGKIGQHLRTNEWLMGIKQRAAMPGGSCQFDLPSYHYWQTQTTALRRADLDAWIAPLLPIKTGINIILRLLRENGKVSDLNAPNGTYQKMQNDRVAHMLRVSLSKDLACIPEVGANKYAINIRFIAADFAPKSSLFKHDIAFKLTFCSLGS